jgi:predicted membrane metal-binding protein
VPSLVLIAAFLTVLGIGFWMLYSNALLGVFSPGLYVLVGFSVGLTAVIPAIAVSGFPAAVRFSGLSFAYNVAYAIAGGLTPVLLSLAMKDNPAAPMEYIAAMAVMGVGLGVFVQWRATRAAAV